MSIQLHQGPIKNPDGEPIGTTPNDPDDGTVRLDVALSEPLTVDDIAMVVQRLDMVLIELRKIRVHLQAGSDIEPTGQE